MTAVGHKEFVHIIVIYDPVPSALNVPLKSRVQPVQLCGHDVNTQLTAIWTVMTLIAFHPVDITIIFL